MPLLEAFLALALTMLSLAMIATLLVEFVHRIARTRENDLGMMLKRLYDSELEPIVKTELQKSGEALKEHKQQLIEELTNNPLMTTTSTGIQGMIESNLRPLVSLSTEDLFKRLAYTDLGKAIKARTEVEIDEFVESLSLAYDAIGDAATDLFKRRAQLISLLAGLIVAFGLNVNALLVFQAYLIDPTIRAKAIAQADAIVAKYEKQTQDGTLDGSNEQKDLKQIITSLKSDVDAMETMGVTVGYGWNVVPAKSWRLGSWIAIALDLFLWVIGVIGTGLLIGLGAPFWFNIVRTLTEALQVARGGRAATNDTATAAVSGPGDERMKALKNTFKRIGGTPPLIQAQVRLGEANKSATDADQAAKAAADALKSVMDVSATAPGDPVVAEAVNAAKLQFVTAFEMKKSCYAALEKTASP